MFFPYPGFFDLFPQLMWGFNGRRCCNDGMLLCPFKHLTETGLFVVVVLTKLQKA